MTGYSLAEDNSIIDYGKIEINNADDIDVIERLNIMNNGIIKLIDRVKPDVVLFEDTQLQKNTYNVSGFKTLAQLQGVIMAYLFKLDLPFYIIPATAWKACCKIKGKDREAQKKNTQIFVKEKFGYDVSEDEADAMGISVYGMKNLKTV